MMARIEDVEAGMYVDWDKYPERQYRCLVLEVRETQGQVLIETVTRRTTKEGKRLTDPLYKVWVGPDKLILVVVPLPGPDGMPEENPTWAPLRKAQPRGAETARAEELSGGSEYK